MNTNQFCNVMAVPTTLQDSETCALSHKRLQTTNCLGKVFLISQRLYKTGLF